MSSYVSKTVDVSTDGTTIVSLNGRWTDSGCSVVIDFTGTGTVNVQGTISKINRGETAVWFDIPGLTGITADASQVITNTPFEALKIEGVTMAAGGAQVQILQAGDC